MYPRRWLEVFVLASCVAWVAGQEDLTQPSRATIQSNVIKLVSAELHTNAEGNLETRCTVLTFPDAPRQSRTSSNTEQPAVANTTLPEPSPKPSGKCPPSEIPTQVYDPESLFGTLTGTIPNVSFIREEAKNYFVAYNGERSFTEAQVLGMILVAMTAEHESIGADINVLKSQIQSGGLGEPQIVVVCLPDGFKEEKVLKECLEDEQGAVGYTRTGVTSSTPPFQKGENEKREIKTVMDLLKGTTSTIPDNKVAQTYLPSPQPSSSFVTSSEQLLPRSLQPPSVTAPEVPAATDLPTNQSPPPEPHSLTKNGLQPSNARQTAATLQLSVSGMIRAVLPLSVSKVSAELSLFFAPVARTSLMFPATAKPNTSKSPSFLKPPLRVSPKTTKSLISATTPTTGDSVLPQTGANFTTAPVHSSWQTLPSGSSTAADASATASSAITSSAPLKNISSPPPSVEPTPYDSSGSSATSSAISPTASQLSTQPSTTPEPSNASITGKQLSRWVTSE